MKNSQRQKIALSAVQKYCRLAECCGDRLDRISWIGDLLFVGSLLLRDQKSATNVHQTVISVAASEALEHHVCRRQTKLRYQTMKAFIFSFTLNRIEHHCTVVVLDAIHCSDYSEKGTRTRDTWTHVNVVRSLWNIYFHTLLWGVCRSLRLFCLVRLDIQHFFQWTSC